MQRTVLCYGDSNTWGYVPQNFTDKNAVISRYSRDQRWPGILQKILGRDYHVIEEGLNSRTTNLDYHIPPDRNGKNYLAPCLYSHAPIDIVVLALGGNDLKVYFDRKADDIKDGLAELIDIIQSSKYGSDMLNAPKVLIISPAIPLPIAEKFHDENGIAVFNGAIDKAKELIGLCSELANEKVCSFLDVSMSIFPSEIDGLHLDEENHAKLANQIADKINYVHTAVAENNKRIMFIRIVKADYVSGFKIKFEFDNFKSGIVDLSDELEGEIFEPLKDINYFKKFELNANAGTITWKNGADFSPEFLYAKAINK